MKNLERVSKEYLARQNYIWNEYYKMSNENQKLEKLISCLTSVFAIQSCSGYRELPGHDNSMPLKKEYMVILKKILGETLSGFGKYPPNIEGRKKPIMGIPPMIDNKYQQDWQNDEESKVHEERRFSIDSEEPFLGRIESSCSQIF